MAQRLGQQELIEPSPTRRLIVPKGCTGLWGVDASTRGVSIATVTAAGTRAVFTESFATGVGGRRLAAIHASTLMLAMSLVELDYALVPGLVVVEQPSGKTPALELVYAVGTIMAAITEAAPCQLESVPSAKWKLVACGKGNIYKPKPSSGEEYGVLTWARANGYTGSSWDEADAWGIVEYARRTVALEAR